MRTFLGVVVGYALFLLPPVALLRIDPEASVSPEFMVVATMYGMFFAFLGGLAARRIARRGDRRAGAIVAVLIAAGALGSLLTFPEGSSSAAAIVTLVLFAPMAFVGGGVRGRRPSHSQPGISPR
ncbi:MAG: hypothetical protein WEE89_22450 [Gemmatimonadota bacterium]